LWLYGKNLDWPRFHSGENRYRVPLPAYPFEGQRYLPPPGLFDSHREALAGTPVPGKNPDISRWFYVPVWKQSRLTASQRTTSGERGNWLVFMDDTGMGTQLVNRLTADGHEVYTVKAGNEFIKEADGVYCINPGTPGDYDTLLEDMNVMDMAPVNVAHLWGVTGPDAAAANGQELERVDRALDRGFFSLLCLVRALAAQEVGEKIPVLVVTDNMQEVVGGEMVFPEKAAVLGPVKVIPLEYPHIDCRSIDIVSSPLQGNRNRQLVDRLLEEFKGSGNSHDRVVAYRGSHRWLQTFEPFPLKKKESVPLSRLREKGVYLVTGGFGGIGFVLARYLAGALQARLILTSRRTPSLEEQQQVRELESLGAEVLVCSADVSLPYRVEEVFRQSLERFGVIDGIIHAAGIADYAGVIARRTREQSGAVLAPKVKGTLVLAELLTRMNIEPDFFVVCSSISSISAPFGQVAYASANAFLDAFTHQRQGDFQRNTFFISINWDTWQTVGMAEEAARRFPGKVGRADARSFLEHGILPEEGIEVFNRILGERLPQVAVSTR
jgi:NADP-dependent 3-hydroxy acid dehydrogenase YdfG